MGLKPDSRYTTCASLFGLGSCDRVLISRQITRCYIVWSYNKVIGFGAGLLLLVGTGAFVACESMRSV